MAPFLRMLLAASLVFPFAVRAQGSPIVQCQIGTYSDVMPGYVCHALTLGAARLTIGTQNDIKGCIDTASRDVGLQPGDVYGRNSLMQACHAIWTSQLVDRSIQPDPAPPPLQTCGREPAGPTDRQVRLHLKADRGGVIRSAIIDRDDPAGEPGTALHVFAEQAVRAVLSPRCQPFPLPARVRGRPYQFDLIFHG